MKKIILFTIFLFPILCFCQQTIQDKNKMCEILKEMLNNDQLHRDGEILGGSFGKKSEFSEREIDSVWKLQIKIDNANTEKLIQLTEKYGWISDDRIDCPKLNIWLIFRHSQRQYFEKISKLIVKENQEKRLNDFHFKLIKNHLEGRPKL